MHVTHIPTHELCRFLKSGVWVAWSNTIWKAFCSQWPDSPRCCRSGMICVSEQWCLLQYISIPMQTRCQDFWLLRTITSRAKRMPYLLCHLDLDDVSAIFMNTECQSVISIYTTCNGHNTTVSGASDCSYSNLLLPLKIQHKDIVDILKYRRSSGLISSLYGATSKTHQPILQTFTLSYNFTPIAFAEKSH